MPKRKVSKAGSFVIGRFDPNKKQTLPRGYDGRGYASGVYGAANGNAVGFAVAGGAGGAPGGAGAAMGEATVDETESVTEAPEEKHLYKFGCVMLPMSQSTNGIMDEWARENIPAESLVIDPDTGMEGYETNHHLTILYGVHNDDPALLDGVIEPLFPLKALQLGKVSKFDAPNFDVIKVEVILDDNLKSIYDTISTNVEHTKTYPDYIPHVTLAYVTKGSCDKLLNNTFFNGISELPNEFLFVNRDGEENVWEGDVRIPVGQSMEVTK